MNSQKRKNKRCTEWLFMEQLLTLSKGAFAEMVASYGFSQTAPWRLLMHACCLDYPNCRMTVVILFGMPLFCRCRLAEHSMMDRNAAPPDCTPVSPWRADTISYLFKRQYRPLHSGHALQFAGAASPYSSSQVRTQRPHLTRHPH